MGSTVDAADAHRWGVEALKRGSAARGFAWVATDGGGALAISFATLLVIARIIGPAEFGLAALVTAIVQFFNLFVEGAFHDALIQREGLTEEHVDSAFWAGLALGGAAALICVLLADPIAAWLGEPKMAQLLPIAGLALPFAAASGVANARLRRALRFREAALRSLAARAGGATLGIALAVSGWGVWSLILQQLAATVLLAFLLHLGIAWRPRLRLSRARLAELARYALPQAGAQALWAARLQFFLVLVGAFAGVAATGYLNIAFRIVNTLQVLLTTVLQQFTLPILARRQGDPAALIRGFERTTRLVGLLAMPVFAGLALVAGDLVPLLLGAEWQPAVIIVRILAAAAILHFAAFAGNAVIRATGRLGYALANAAAAFAATVGGMLALHAADPAGLALLWAAPAILVLPLTLAWMWRITGLGAATQLAPAASPALATLVMALAVLLLAALWPAHLAPPLRLAGETLLGIIVYGAVAFPSVALVRRAAAEGRP